MAHPELTQRPAGQTSGSTGRRWTAAQRAGDFRTVFALSDIALATRDPATRDDPARPYHERWVWDGAPPDGREVLVRCYHGLGDTLMFARYLPELRARAARVTLEVQPELAGLLAGWADAVHPFDVSAPLPPSACDIEAMELPHALRQPPDPRPYLHAEPLGVRGIGVCWASGGWDGERDVPAAMLGTLRDRPLVSLQRGPAGAEAAVLGAVDPLDGDMDVRRMASLIAGLTAVVTVDTMVAHLAAALGRPTVVMLKHDPDWRWGTDWGTPWYGCVATLRQAAPGKWGSVIERLPGTLGEFTGS